MAAPAKKTNSVRIIAKIAALSLFSVFFILHGYNENFGLIPFVVLFHLFLK